MNELNTVDLRNRWEPLAKQGTLESDFQFLISPKSA